MRENLFLMQKVSDLVGEIYSTSMHACNLSALYEQARLANEASISKSIQEHINHTLRLKHCAQSANGFGM